MARDLPARLGVIARAEQMVAVGHRCERAVQRDDFEIVLRQLEIADHFRSQQADDVGAYGIFKPRIDLLGHSGAAEHMAPFQDEDFFTGFGEIGGAGQAVVATADDDCVI